MTKQDLQAELKEKVKPGLKPSDLKKLKRSKSADDIPSPTPNIPLKKSQSQLAIPVLNQPTPSEQISQLKQTLIFTQNTAQNYLKNLQLAQAQISQLEDKLKENNKKQEQLQDQILQLRLDKIKEFGDYYEKKQELENELELNITEGISEINRLESKLLATNKKRLELAEKLSKTQTKNSQLELKLLNNQEPHANSHFLTDYWPVLLIALLYCCSAWLLSKNTDQ